MVSTNDKMNNERKPKECVCRNNWQKFGTRHPNEYKAVDVFSDAPVDATPMIVDLLIAAVPPVI